MPRAVLGIAAVLLALPVPSAHAARLQRERVCSYTAEATPGDPETQQGQLRAGPLAAAELDPAALEITVTCSIRTESGTHTGPVAATASASGTGAVVLAAAVTWRAGLDGFASICTEALVTRPGGASTRFYWDEVAGEFSTSPDVPCTGARCLSIDCGPLFDEVDALFADVVDPAICPLLAEQFPPEGDSDVWDCPPYGS